MIVRQRALYLVVSVIVIVIVVVVFSFWTVSLLSCQAQLIREQQRLREQEEERLRKEEEERIRKEEEAERLKEEKVSIVYCIALFSFLSVCLRVCLWTAVMPTFLNRFRWHLVELLELVCNCSQRADLATIRLCTSAKQLFICLLTKTTIYCPFY